MPLQQKEQAEVMHKIVGDGKKWEKLCNFVSNEQGKESAVK